MFNSVLISTPDPTTFLNTIGAFSLPYFNELLLPALIIAGILVGGLLVSFIFHGIIGAFTGLLHFFGLGHKED